MCLQSRAELHTHRCRERLGRAAWCWQIEANAALFLTSGLAMRSAFCHLSLRWLACSSSLLMDAHAETVEADAGSDEHLFRRFLRAPTSHARCLSGVLSDSLATCACVPHVLRSRPWYFWACRFVSLVNTRLVLFACDLCVRLVGDKEGGMFLVFHTPRRYPELMETVKR